MWLRTRNGRFLVNINSGIYLRVDEYAADIALLHIGVVGQESERQIASGSATEMLAVIDRVSDAIGQEYVLEV